MKDILLTYIKSLWLGIVNLFQTFEDLESVKVKQADIQAVRQVLDEDQAAESDSEELLCQTGERWQGGIRSS